MRTTTRRNIAYALTLLAMFLFMASCEKQSHQEKAKVVPVEAVRVQRGTLNESLFYVGDIKAEDEAIVYPKVTGKIIEKIAQEGDAVKRNDVLVYIDRDEVGFQFQKAPVESPIDGMVGRVYVDVGTSVSPQTPVGLVVDMDSVKVKINVVEKDLPRIKKGQAAKATLDAYPGETFDGVVEKVSPVVDLTSRTALIEVRIPNTGHRLKPGMFARLNILVDTKEDVLIIPRDALIKENSSHYVFVIRDTKAYRRKIEIGLHENNKFEAVKGLSEGELVVTMGNARLKEDDTIVLVNTDAKENAER